MSNFYEIQKLVELFNPKKDDNSDSDNEGDAESFATCVEQPKKDVTKGDKAAANIKKNPYSKIERRPKEEAEAKVVTDPYDEKQFFSDGTDNGSGESDWRQCPKWDISYRQKVTPSDIYLQMGNKSPATASCENMIISVHLPGEDHRNIDLKVTKQHLDVMSPKFKLALPLTQPVDPQRGNAQWDKNSEKLIITLEMDREFDYINF